MHKKRTHNLLVAAVLTAACGPPAAPTHSPPPTVASPPDAPANQPAKLSLFARPPCTLEDLPADASEALDKLKVAAKAFFQADHYNVGGNLMHKRFPPFPKGTMNRTDAIKAGDQAAKHDTSWTPGRSCCRQPGQRCKDPAAWRKSETWRSLHFQPSGPHSFQVRFVSQGINKAATYRAEIRIEPGCRGAPCVFRLTGTVDDEFGVNSEGPILTVGGRNAPDPD
jgi:hypothetical protein